MKSFLIFLSLLLVGIGFYISWEFFRIIGNHFTYNGDGDLKMDVTGQVGDFIGGVVGTIINAAAFCFLYLTLKEQRKSTDNQKLSFEKERFESKFFDLIKLHRDNVAELRYSKFEGTSLHTSEGRKVMKEIFEEFLECYREVRKFARNSKIDEIVSPKYKVQLETLIKINNLKCAPEQLALIDIAYSVIFFGLSIMGEPVLRDRFKNCYVNKFYFRLIAYLKLKPKKDFKIEYENWEAFRSVDLKQLKSTIEEVYLHRHNSKNNQNLSQYASYFLLRKKCDVYYSGHQDRLGHYFRHLFQSYVFLNDSRIIDFEQKYFYGKTLRTQLSISEQAMLFVSSVSSLGMKWELNPEYDKNSKDSFKLKRENFHLITNYNIIKNLPGDRIIDITYKNFYSNVGYENDQIINF